MFSRWNIVLPDFQDIKDGKKMTTCVFRTYKTYIFIKHKGLKKIVTHTVDMHESKKFKI